MISGEIAYVFHGNLPGFWARLTGMAFAEPSKVKLNVSELHVIGTPARVSGKGTLELPEKVPLEVSPRVEGEFKVVRWLGEAKDVELRVLPPQTYAVLVADVKDIASLIALARLNREATFLTEIDFAAEPETGFVLVHATLNRPNIAFRNPALLSLQRRLAGLPPVAERLGLVMRGSKVFFNACPHMQPQLVVTPTGYLNCMPADSDPYVYLLRKTHEPYTVIEYQPQVKEIKVEERKEGE